MAITDWPSDERPREKISRNGPASLSDAELLAVILRTGVRGKSAVELARSSLQRFGGLCRLLSASEADFCAVAGLGKAKHAQILALMEIARRTLREVLQDRDVLSSPDAVRDYLRLWLQARQEEVFIGVFLDSQNRVIAAEELFHGTLNQTSVYPREVLKRALHHNAAAVIFAHNHPSGVAEPSGADEHLTRTLKQALALVDVKVLDHFIVGSAAALSFAERGLL